MAILPQLRRSDLVLLQSDLNFTELYLAKTATLVSLWPKGYYNQGDRHKFCHLTCCLHLVLLATSHGQKPKR